MEGMPQGDGLVALTVAGFDPSSGAGITADLAVFAAHGIFGTSALTALTVQSTMGVRRLQPVDAMLLEETLACLHADLPPDGVKIGMLGGVEQVRAVARYLRTLPERAPSVFVVLDPVIHASSGTPLLSEEGLKVLQSELLPLVDVVTPNTEELAVLTGLACTTDEEIETACRAMVSLYPRLAVLATGGHRSRPDDVLLHGDQITPLRGEFVHTRATHGTGCALSSALLCGVLKGATLPDAAAAAKAYVVEAMRCAIPRGKGKGPMHLLWPIAGQAQR